MARTLYFLDGSKEVLLLEDDGEFEAILEERLGKDVAGYFMEQIDEAVDAVSYEPPSAIWADDTGCYVCSHCDEAENVTSDYCPNCGARMRKEADYK